MKYIYEFSTVGVALSKEEKYSGWTKYQYPSKLKKMGSSRASRKKMGEVTSKLGEKLRLSQRDVKTDLPFYSDLIEHNPELQNQLDLEDDEVEFISKF